MKSCMPEVLYYAYVPCILHWYASATEMGLQHTCDVPPSVKAWMVLCMEYLHAADTETFRMYADIISRGVYAKCNLQIICEMFCNNSWLLACVYAFLKALALDLRVMIIILQNFQDLRLSDFLHVLYCLISCIYICVQQVLFSLLLSYLFPAEPLP